MIFFKDPAEKEGREGGRREKGRERKRKGREGRKKKKTGHTVVLL